MKSHTNIFTDYCTGSAGMPSIVLLLICCLSTVYGSECKSTSLPPSVDHSQSPFLRPLFRQALGSCGEANGVGLIFTYEINALRNLSAHNAGNQYPYCFTLHFLNDGGEMECEDPKNGWRIIQENGIPDVIAYGGFTTGFPTRWLNGYDAWYCGMHNRLDSISTFAVNTPAGLQRLKQWLYDHENGSPAGGLLCVGVNSSEYVLEPLPQATPHAGDYVLLQWGLFSGHSLTVIGYNDSISYDINQDGQYTNDIDITGDTVVDLRDWEIGAVRTINTWGTEFADSGCAWMLYRVLAMSEDWGGIKNGNTVCGITVPQQYTPRLTFRVRMKHSSRNALRIIPGASPLVQAVSPTVTKNYSRMLNYCGGSFPLQGLNMDSTIEIGLDVSDLLDSLGRNEARFFLQIHSTYGQGKIERFSLMDYQGTTVKEFQCSEKDVALLPGQTATVSILWNDSVSAITDQIHPQEYPFSQIIKLLRHHLVIQLPVKVDGYIPGSISVLNSQGKLVGTLEVQQDKNSGLSAVWDYGNLQGARVSPGIYFIVYKSMLVSIYNKFVITN